jgi:PAS domain S-box-containing protein
MKALADQAAVTITNAQLIDQLERAREEVQRRADAERSLREISANISAIREPDTVLQQTINEATRLLRADGGIIDLLDPSENVLRWAYDTGMFRDFPRDRFQAAETQLGKGIAGRAVLERRVIRTGDYLSHEFVHTPTADDFATQLGIQSVIVAPILGEGGPVGAIEIYSRRGEAFDDLDATVLAGLADQAAIAIQNARLIEALDRSAEEIRRRADAERALREIAANISAIRDADVILQQTVDEAKRLLESTDARIDLLEQGRMRWAFTSEGAHIQRLQEMDATFGVGEGIAGMVVASGKPFRTGTYLDDDRFPHTEGSDSFVRAGGLSSALAVPLLGETGPLGAISVATPRPDAYDDGDAELLQALADQAAIAIQNARLIAELQRSRTELAQRADAERSLREMAARIAELRDPGELLHRIVEESRRLLGSDGAHLTRMREDGQVLVPVVVAGELDEETQGWLLSLEFPLMAGINGLAAGTGQAVWTEDYKADPRIPHDPLDDDSVADRLGLRSMAAVPLRSPEGGIIGTLAVSYRVPHAFDDEALGLLKGLADHAAIALTNTSLYERLRESERRYRHLVQNSPDLVWSIDEEARLTFVSDTCERLTGWKPEELLGRHFGALVHESSRDVAEIDWRQGMRLPQQELRGRLNLLHRDGHPIPAEFSAMSALDDEGRFAGANGAVRDMTEQDRLERELRESEERYRFLVENSPDIVFSVSADGRFTYVSETIERALGYRPDDVVGQPFADIAQGEPGSPRGQRWAEMAEDPSREMVFRYNLVHRDGRLIPFEVSARGLERDGGFAGVYGAARDVTERVRLERDLRRQAGELAAGEERAHLARELHDSVTQALFSMTLLTRTIEMLLDRDSDQVREQLGALRELQREALAEMRALIFELRPGNLEQEGLYKALRTHTAALQGRIGLPIVVNAEFDERLPIAVEEVLYRIAQEALHNVVKHAGAREVRIELARDGTGVHLRVVDDGKGFDPGAVPDGHLGLAGMRARTDRIGARLDVMSRPGRGTTIEAVVSPEAIDEARRRAAATVGEVREIGVASSAE